MSFRLTIALFSAVLGVAFFASPTPAQMRGARASGSALRTRASFAFGARAGAVRGGQRRYSSGSGLLQYPYFFYPDYDDDSFAPQAVPDQGVMAPPAQPPAAAAAPAESLVLENRGGEWVRVPTGSQLPTQVQPEQPASTRAPAIGPDGGVRNYQPPAPLPRSILVFRDGHREEIERYVIEDDIIDVSVSHWDTGSWTKKISIADLDVPATLKLNQERGGKFNLPSGPNEVVVRF